MKRKIILISLITLVTFLSTLGVIYYNKTEKVSLFCGENGNEVGCSYIKYGSEDEEVKFGYGDILQCSIETVYKPVKNNKAKEVVDNYELNLYITNRNDSLKIKSKNSKELIMICAKIPDKLPFKIVKRQKSE